jgi:hypothetical protein
MDRSGPAYTTHVRFATIFSPLTVGLAFLNSHPQCSKSSLFIHDRYADKLVQLYYMLLFRVRGGQVAIVSGDGVDAISTFECHGWRCSFLYDHDSCSCWVTRRTTTNVSEELPEQSEYLWQKDRPGILCGNLCTVSFVLTPLTAIMRSSIWPPNL